MRILIICQGLFGGTDLLLNRYYSWLLSNNVDAEIYGFRKKYSNLRGKFDLAILPSSEMDKLIEIKHKKCIIDRMLIWIMGCGCFTDSYFNPINNNGFVKIINGYLHYISCKFGRQLYKGGSLCFTDYVGFSVNQSLMHLKTERSFENEDIIPIAIDLPKDIVPIVQNGNSGNYRYTWIGRVSKDFKMLSIEQLITDIDIYNKDNNINCSLTIIGDGDGLAEVIDYSKKCKVDITYIPNIEYNDIHSYLKDHTDIFVAMGTSSLDGAKYGFPTIVIQPIRSGEVIPNAMRYRWIFNSVGFSLGEYQEIDGNIQQKNDTFASIMKLYNTDNTISKKCLEYSYSFDSNLVFKKLLERKLPERIKNSTWKELYRYSVIKHTKIKLKHLYNVLCK